VNELDFCVIGYLGNWNHQTEIMKRTIFTIAVIAGFGAASADYRRPSD